MQSVHGVPSFVAVAHGQPLVVADFPLPVGSKAMIYNWQVSSVTPITLTRNSVSQEVQIPDDVEITYTAYKEVCAGIGGIGLGANLMGMQSLASMDLNFGAVEIMKKNGVPNAILGDIQNPLDRWALHSTPYAARCWLMSGFPCQPLSTQGDQRGDLDPRSIPFFSMVKMAWEQQTSAIMLECVPNAGHATYVQTALQQLAYSLGMELLQTTLQLHNTWPCRRHRWWAIIAPKAYQPTAYLDLPHWDETKKKWWPSFRNGPPGLQKKRDCWHSPNMSCRCTTTRSTAKMFDIWKTPCHVLASFTPMAVFFKPVHVDAEATRSAWTDWRRADCGVSMCAAPPAIASGIYMFLKQRYFVAFLLAMSSQDQAETRYATLVKRHRRYSHCGCWHSSSRQLIPQWTRRCTYQPMSCTP